MIGKYNPDTTYFIDNKYHWDLMCKDPDSFHIEYHSTGVGLAGDAGTFQAEYEIKKKLGQKYNAYLMWGKPKTN